MNKLNRYNYQTVKRVSCCYSRAGVAKHIYDSKEQALKAIKKVPGEVVMLEPYKCEQHPGKYHLRTKK